MQLPKTITHIAPWIGLLGASIRGRTSRKLDNFISLSPFTTREQYLWKRKASFFSRTIKFVFTTLLFYMVCFVGIAIFVSSINAKAHEDLTQLQKIPLPPEFATLEQEMNKFNESIDRLLSIKNQLWSIVPAVKAVDKITFPGVTINSFSLSVNDTNKAAGLTISGSASTRERYLAFKKYLEIQKVFKDIKTPLQSLEQRENINFTINFNYDL